jgi:hypothetical protein
LFTSAAEGSLDPGIEVVTAEGVEEMGEGVADGAGNDWAGGSVFALAGIGEGISAGASMETESSGTGNGASPALRLISRSPAAFVERTMTLVPWGIFTKPMEAPFAIMSILASFTRIPERRGSPAKIPGIAAKAVARIAEQRVRCGKGRGFMESNLIVNRAIP